MSSVDGPTTAAVTPKQKKGRWSLIRRTPTLSFITPGRRKISPYDDYGSALSNKDTCPITGLSPSERSLLCSSWEYIISTNNMVVFGDSMMNWMLSDVKGMEEIFMNPLNDSIADTKRNHALAITFEFNQIIGALHNPQKLSSRLYKLISRHLGVVGHPAVGSQYFNQLRPGFATFIQRYLRVEICDPVIVAWQKLIDAMCDNMEELEKSSECCVVI